MSPIFWLGLVTLLVVVLALDLGVFHREDRAQTTGEALLWSVVWIATALLFNGFVYFARESYHFGSRRFPGSRVRGQTNDRSNSFNLGGRRLLGCRESTRSISP